MVKSGAARRLRALGRALRPQSVPAGAEAHGPTAAPLVTTRRTDLLPAVSPGPQGLSDGEVRAFCARGFVVVQPSSLDAAFHRSLLAQFNALQDSESAKGHLALNNNVLPSVPDLQKVYDDPAVVSALRSLLGPGHVMHQHRGIHLTTGGENHNQTWHKVTPPQTRVHHPPTTAVAPCDGPCC